VCMCVSDMQWIEYTGHANEY